MTGGGQRGALAAAVLSLATGMAISVVTAHFLRHAPPPAANRVMAIAPVRPAEQPPAPQVEPARPTAIPDAVLRPPTAVPAIVRPAWQAYAVPAAAGKAMIAVIIDDMGLDRRRSARVVALPAPLTISFMTYADHLAEQADDAHARGHELMMHMPMQPLSASLDPGPDVLTDQLSPAELRRRIDSDLDRFQGYVGVNNHMGSRFTADAPGMQIVMEELHKRGLLFIDSLTTDKSVGLAMAHKAGVPAAARNLFLDNVDDPAVIAAQLAKVEAEARRTGSAIAIGHPRDKTIAALADWLPGLTDKGLTLVPVTVLVRARAPADGK